ncbi:copper homeostasis periplasmic binding protein CopC [Pseudomonas sp. NPDC007930]|uniref:copper homeostasis periplasmic binding protein CopC n=1 Tax=Pseudomonas sp. NPDC007930 TaxID=3364417 RepID=UPI0036E1F0CA
MPAAVKNLIATTALLSALAFANSAWAHAHLASASPAANATVPSPAALQLKFSEGVEASFSSVNLSLNGQPVEVSKVTTAPNDLTVLLVTPAKPLAAGNYSVQWRVVSVDTHKSEGRYSFTVKD